MMKDRVCELCNGDASLYCHSDSAFLCWNCDTRVHEANFLVARHIREVFCCKCRCFAGNQISGGVARPLNPACRSCSPENPSADDDSLSSSSSSACVSSTEYCATAPKKIQSQGQHKTKKIASSSSVKDASDENCSTPAEVTSASKMIQQTKERESRARHVGSHDPKAEEVFVSWSRKIGVNGNCVISLALRALGICEGKLMVLPFRVAMATSFWFGLRFCGDRSVATFQNLRRVGEITGVPGKLVVAAESKLARALRHRRARREFEEGWAEC